MKCGRILTLIMSFILMISVVACGVPAEQAYIVDNSILIQKQDSDFLMLDMGSDVDDIVALVENNIIYSAYSDDGNAIHYYKFDIDTNTTYELGKIDNPYIHTGSIAQIEDRLYFYMSEVVIDGDGSEEYLVATLYEIDTGNNSVNSIYSDTVDQTLIYVDVLNDDILALKGNFDEAAGTTFIDAVSVGDENITETDHNVILSVDYDRANGSGEVIYNFTQSENHVYTLTVV